MLKVFALNLGSQRVESLELNDAKPCVCLGTERDGACWPWQQLLPNGKIVLVRQPVEQGTLGLLVVHQTALDELLGQILAFLQKHMGSGTFVAGALKLSEFKTGILFASDARLHQGRVALDEVDWYYCLAILREESNTVEGASGVIQEFASVPTDWQ